MAPWFPIAPHVISDAQYTPPTRLNSTVESRRRCVLALTFHGSCFGFVQGYRYRRAYIATQGPLAETTEDFWRMLWEHNSTIVVMLTKLRELGRVGIRTPPYF